MVSVFDSREVDDAPCTRITAWLSRMESAFELHFGLLKGIPLLRLLHIPVQLLDPVQRHMSAIMWTCRPRVGRVLSASFASVLDSMSAR